MEQKPAINDLQRDLCQAGKVRSRLAAVLRDEKERIVFQEGFSGAEGKATAQHGMRRYFMIY